MSRSGEKYVETGFINISIFVFRRHHGEFKRQLGGAFSKQLSDKGLRHSEREVL
ncbi:hypothetical protein GHT09_018088 [Marmota monax]|uniref:Uncharacterized protein n=1 Tax=Marmota monax TaxID=9995 RepID=A0A834Q4U7_MARMO|nr:hypothetical protein GHT09_018088 [Marmota monax]